MLMSLTSTSGNARVRTAHRLTDARRRFHLRAPLAQHMLCEFPRIRIVVYNQDADAIEDDRLRMPPATKRRCGFVRSHRFDDGKGDREHGPAIDPLAVCFDAASVHLDEMAGDGKAETQAAVPGADPGVGLSQAFEHMQNLDQSRRAASAITISVRDVLVSSDTYTFPADGVNLIAFETRFRTICCRRGAGSARTSPLVACPLVHASSMPLSSADGRRVSTAASTIGASSMGSSRSRTFPDRDAAHVEQIVDQL